jgi:hypothetical protein
VVIWRGQEFKYVKGIFEELIWKPHDNVGDVDSTQTICIEIMAEPTNLTITE